MFTINDTGPALTGTVNANLTGATIDVHLKRADRTVLTKTGTITDATNGGWRVDWETGDLNTAGLWRVEVQVTFSNGEIQTFGPSPFTVQKEIA